MPGVNEPICQPGASRAVSLRHNRQEVGRIHLDEVAGEHLARLRFGYLVVMVKST